MKTFKIYEDVLDMHATFLVICLKYIYISYWAHDYCCDVFCLNENLQNELNIFAYICRGCNIGMR